MPLGVVPADVADESLQFAKQSFRYPGMDAMLAGDKEVQELYAKVLAGIISNVKTQEGGFRATSGVVLPYYLNLSTNFMDHLVAPLIVRLMTALLLRLHGDLAAPGQKLAVVGMEVAGGMLVSQLAASAIPALAERFDFIYMRKTRKTSGTAQQLEAKQEFTARTAASPLLKAIWVDDCNSTGSSLCEGITVLLEDYNIDVTCALYLVDRSADRQGLEPSRQRLSDQRFTSGRTRIYAAMDLAEVDAKVIKK